MSVSAELQKLIHDTLLADAPVMALVDGIYDSVPTSPFGAKNAYISFGPSDGVDDGADCIMGTEHTFQIDVWSRTVGKVGCRRIVDAVRRSLHERDDIELTENALCEIRVELWQVLDDQDGLTSHGIVQVTAYVEEPA